MVSRCDSIFSIFGVYFLTYTLTCFYEISVFSLKVCILNSLLVCPCANISGNRYDVIEKNKPIAFAPICSVPPTTGSMISGKLSLQSALCHLPLAAWSVGRGLTSSKRINQSLSLQYALRHLPLARWSSRVLGNAFACFVFHFRATGEHRRLRP